MADPVIMAANERIKSLSRTMMQLGAALLAAAVVRTYSDFRVSLAVLGWFLVATVIIWTGWKILMFLESEN